MPYDHFESDFERSLYASRQDTLKKIAALGQQPYPNTFTPPADHPLHTLVDIRARVRQGHWRRTGSPAHPRRRRRTHHGDPQQGKAGFATLQQDGQRLQVYVQQRTVGEPASSVRAPRPRRPHRRQGLRFRTRTNEMTSSSRTHVPLQGCCRCPKSGTASPTSSSATASATSTSSRTPKCAKSSSSAPRSSAIRTFSTTAARGSRDAHDAAHRRRRRGAPSSPTTTRSTSTCSCASRPSSTSSACSSAAWTGSTRSTATSATKASPPSTTPSSP